MGIHGLCVLKVKKQMSKSKYIKRELLPGLPEPAISLINKGLSSLWEIQPKTLSDDSVATYLFRLNRTEFRYLNSQGSPLSVRPQKIGELQILNCIMFENYEDKIDKLVKNLLIQI